MGILSNLKILFFSISPIVILSLHAGAQMKIGGYSIHFQPFSNLELEGNRRVLHFTQAMDKLDTGVSGAGEDLKVSKLSFLAGSGCRRINFLSKRAIGIFDYSI